LGSQLKLAHCRGSSEYSFCCFVETSCYRSCSNRLQRSMGTFALARLGIGPQVRAERTPKCVSGRIALPQLDSRTSPRHNHSMPFAFVCHGKGALAERRPMVCLTQYFDIYHRLDQLCDHSVYCPSFRSPLLTPLRLSLVPDLGRNGPGSLHHRRRETWLDGGATN